MKGARAKAMLAMLRGVLAAAAATLLGMLLLARRWGFCTW